MMLAAILGLEPGQMNVHGTAAPAMHFQSMQIVEEEILLTGKLLYKLSWCNRHG